MQYEPDVTQTISANAGQTTQTMSQNYSTQKMTRIVSAQFSPKKDQPPSVVVLSSHSKARPTTGVQRSKNVHSALMEQSVISKCSSNQVYAPPKVTVVNNKDLSVNDNSQVMNDTANSVMK